MSRLTRWIREHKRLAAVVFVAAGGALAVATYWFAPWKLFLDTVVDEGVPAAHASAPPPPRAGSFRSLEHDTSGKAVLLQTAGGPVLRLEDLRTSNGPDLVVILSPTPATEDSWTAYGKGEVVSLGALKGNLGSQNYAIPPSVDLGRFKSAVIWCQRFGVAFGAAPLER